MSANNTIPVMLPQIQKPFVISGDTTSAINPAVLADVHLRLESPVGDEEMISFSFATVPNADIRCDNTGYLNFHVKTGGIGYTFHSKLDNSDPIFTIRPTAIYAVKDLNCSGVVNAAGNVNIGPLAKVAFDVGVTLNARVNGSNYELYATQSGTDVVLATWAI